MSRALFLLLAVFPTIVVAQTREEKVRDDRKQVEADGFWIYNDLPKAFVAASKSGKPLVVVFRCIPCEECVKLDDDLVDQDPVIRSLLEQFVCARQVSTNGFDLGTFQYDTDQSFAVFLLNADGTIYGRFGTRSHRSEWLGDVSLAGLAKALEGALELHRDYPANRSSLMGKRGQPMEVSSPEKYPSLEGKYTASLDFGDSVVKSCIHCHQIGDAQREWYRAARKPIPEKVLFPYPHPKSIGLTMDPKERATILDVAGGSAADKADLRPGDRMERFNGQPMLSIADVQWVLHNIDPAGGSVPVVVRREGKLLEQTLSVGDGWRRAGDLSWRVTSWGLRRMTTGGMVLVELSPEERAELNSDDSMALRVQHLGKYGLHGAALKAGFQKGDVVVQFDGQTDLITEGAVLTYGVTHRLPGDRVDVTVLRDGQRKTFVLPMQR
jgi:hypothetical protein